MKDPKKISLWSALCVGGVSHEMKQPAGGNSNNENADHLSLPRGVMRGQQQEELRRMLNLLKENKKQAFLESLKDMPQRGEGLHDYTMGLCNRGIRAGFTADELYDILEPLRPWHPNELESTIQKAEEEAGDWQPEDDGNSFTSGKPKYSRAACTSPAAAAGKILDEDPERAAKIQANLIRIGGGEIDPFGPEVRAASNPKPNIIPRIWPLVGSEFASGMLTFLRTAYRPDDILYIGNKKETHDRQPDHIKPVSYWIDFFSDKLNAIARKPVSGTRIRLLMSLGFQFPAFCINPLTGETDAKGSFRSSGCVKEFRYLLLESDKLPLNQQVPLLAGLGLPVVAMTFSGGKSIHAILKVDKIPGVGSIKDLAEWKQKIGDIFRFLLPLGLDGATKDPVRLSRLPGIWRPDKQKFQQLLFLNPNGGFHG